MTSVRQRMQSALNEFTPGIVTIGSLNYACAVVIGAISPKMQDDGINYRNGQDATINISKDRLATAPAARTVITINGLDFRVVSTSGGAAYDQGWLITARRFV